MTKKRTTKSSLLVSALSLLLCISMLIGSTFAWFTDSVTSKKNIIAAGNLDVEMYHSNLAVINEKVDESTTLFNNLKGEAMLWEPGAVSYENLKVVNEGSLALAYSLSILTDNENYVLDPSGAQYGLSQVLKVGVVEGGFTATDREGVVNSVDDADWMTLQEFVFGGKLMPKNAGKSEDVYGVVIYWEPTANDNNWNLNNGKKLSDGGEALSIDLGVQLVATQEEFESDSFGTDYDAKATFPEFNKGFRAGVSVLGKVDKDNKLKEDVTIGKEHGRMYAVVPKGTLIAPNTLRLALTVDTTSRSNNIEMVRGQVSRSLDVHITGIDEKNTVPITIDLGEIMPKGLKDSSIQIYHVENKTPNQMAAVDTLTAHNQFVYNAKTGEMAVNMATFSEVTAVVAASDPWDGTIDTSWYNTEDKAFKIDSAEKLAGLGAIVGGMVDGIQDTFKGKTITLTTHLDLGSDQGKVWYPIGYGNTTKSYIKTAGVSVSSDVYSFEGTFDGNNKTISNIYQNTWDMFGDYNSGYSGTPNHYKDGMGIFGFVFNGTIKNLTVNNFQSDGEFCTTGCVAAYAAGTSSFENITITRSNPRAYNVPNGGVVGYAYDEAGVAAEVTFNNVKVDSSTKITALWGSWDVACAGILGRMGDKTKVNMTKCDVAAEIDVFNDVCGNYQYYQYRYCGMLIGTAGSDSDPEDQIENVAFSNVRVRYGDWAERYYCELESNSQASYTEDYQFSRLEKIDDLSEIWSGSIWLKEGNFICDGQCYHIVKKGDTLVKHDHTEAENHRVVHIPFKQLYTGYGWGSKPSATGVNVEEYIYSITYMQDQTVLHTEYVKDNSEAKLVKTDKAQVTVSGNVSFNGRWSNAASVEIKQIEAGNKTDYVLYPIFENVYTVRWLDEDGNVINSTTATNKTRYDKLEEPTTTSKYSNLQFDHWEIRKNDGTYEKVSGSYSITGNVTLYPYFVYKATDGSIALEPHDVDGDGRVDYYTVEAASGLEGEITIPGVVNGVPVSVITDLNSSAVNGLFSDGIEKIIIKEGVTEIGSEALGGTVGLKEVTIPVSVEKMGEYAFSSKTLGSLVGSWAKNITINYEGTKNQWEALVINSPKWDAGVATVTVKFPDGSSKTYR